MCQWLRVKDSNLRLPGYEPDSLTTDVTRDNFNQYGESNDSQIEFEQAG